MSSYAVNICMCLNIWEKCHVHKQQPPFSLAHLSSSSQMDGSDLAVVFVRQHFSH